MASQRDWEGEREGYSGRCGGGGGGRCDKSTSTMGAICMQGWGRGGSSSVSSDCGFSAPLSTLLESGDISLEWWAVVWRYIVNRITDNPISLRTPHLRMRNFWITDWLTDSLSSAQLSSASRTADTTFQASERLCACCVCAKGMSAPSTCGRGCPAVLCCGCFDPLSRVEGLCALWLLLVMEKRRKYNRIEKNRWLTWKGCRPEQWLVCMKHTTWQVCMKHNKLWSLVRMTFISCFIS